ncbi:MAG: hypothetical protein CMJ78_08850, partial [Planctomycetaceae bacterium]|nr:hypothetical protein [Planctomycetaceae bacterium]
IDYQSPGKREKIIDQMLASEEFVRHMTTVYSVMLMERRSNDAGWLAFLKASIEQNKPWPEMVAEILANDGSDAKNRGPVNFFTARNVEPNLLTRETGRLFFGMDIQCAQCHNHPTIDDYLQEDYYGIYAFLSRTYQFQPDKKKPAQLADKPEGDAKFKSVFTGYEGETKPKLPGEAEVAEPIFVKGQEYKVKPDPKKKEIKPVPHYSRRLKFAEVVKPGTNKAFRNNFANRLWAHMMGRGIVHPVDLHHSDNPPSHPELLDMLGDEVAAMKFDLRGFLKQIALTKAYQRSVSLSDQLVNSVPAMKTRLAQLQAEQKTLSEKHEATTTQLSPADEKLTAAKKELAPLAAEFKKASDALAAALKAHEPNAKALAEAQKKRDEKKPFAAPLADAAAKALAAAKLLPNEKELAAAAAKFDAASKKVAAELAVLEKAVADQGAKAKTTGDALIAAQKGLRTIQPKHDAVAKKVADARQQSSEVNRAERVAYVAEKVGSRQIKSVESMIAYAEVVTTHEAVQVALNGQAKATATLQATRNKAASDATTAKQTFDAAKKNSDTATNQLASTKQLLANKGPANAALTEADKSVASVIAKLSNDPQLKQAAAVIKARLQTLSADVDGLKKTMSDQESAVKATAAQMVTASQQLATANSALAAADKQLAPALKARDESAAKLSKSQESLDQSYEELTKFWSNQFVMRPLEHLTAEQLCWSLMVISGLPKRQLVASEAEINKKTPLKDEEKKDPAKVAARKKQIADAAYAKLNANVGAFVKLFSANAGQPQHEFFATFDQALFFANAGTVRSWMSPNGDNLAGRLAKLDNSKDFADELYLGVLTRRPTTDEVADVTAYLASRGKERAAATQELIWALVTSTEFRFNH